MQSFHSRGSTILHVQVPFDATENHLTSFFSKYGSVTRVHLMRENGKSLGWGFVTFENRAMAEKAVDEVDGKVRWDGEISWVWMGVNEGVDNNT